ncbi:MAG: NADPH:quinone reductase [Sulfitobacter sp.]|jgi:NADPH:quinone reductase|uniref:NADPH:quinone reductase n=1 Tax=Sulfitobacter sp. TaxID=1903071 RepID=UPI000C10519D|nr:zinc-binding dehydrogenase [Roseobacter sp.]PHR09195.1 MAG: zinc-binding dehydrogenase [Sulfitobacter sp.]|tara:strand:+ start:755 stop:1744 length:990 start_codon:yes stop_codon:yes gene_type:complete
MRAITYSSLGEAKDVLSMAEMPTPSPAKGEVLVRLAYSGVNPSDVKSRRGRPGMTRPPYDRVIPHSDGAGIIESVGDGVDADRVGQRVWIWNGQWQRPFGTAATHIVLPQDQAVALADDVTFETAASFGIPGLTATHAVFNGADIKGQTLLVQGGAGTVGYIAVQLAKWGGARVIATTGAAGAERAKSAGADVVLDYAAPDLAAQILAANDGRPVDQIIEVEFGVNIALDAEVIKPNGRIAAYGSAKVMDPTLPFLPLLFKAVTIDIILVYLLTDAQRSLAIEKLHDALRQNALDCPVETIFALSETVQAHEAVEAGARKGAILIDCQT